MGGSGNRDERRLLEALEMVLSATDLDTLARAMMQASDHAIDSDTISYNEVDIQNDRFVTQVSSPDVGATVAAHLDALVAHMPEHPVSNFFLDEPDAEPLAISDFISRPAFHDLGLYREFYRHVEVEHQLALNVGNQLDGTIAIALSRSGSDYGERDREIASRLQRGFRFVYQALWLRETLVTLIDGQDLDRQYRIYRALGLTQRQAEVCAWLLRGKSNAEIAIILDIAPETAKRHAAAIYRRLGVPGRAGLQRAVLARLLGGHGR